MLSCCLQHQTGSSIDPGGIFLIQQVQTSGVVAEQLVATGKCCMAFDKPFFNEFAVKTSVPASKVLDALVAVGILGGVRIADDMLLICVTEQRTKEEMDKFIETVKNI